MKAVQGEYLQLSVCLTEGVDILWNFEVFQSAFRRHISL